MSGAYRPRLARLAGQCILRAVAQFVPSRLRQEWLAEWRGELSALVSYRSVTLRAVLQFVAGCLPDAFELRRLGAEPTSRRLGTLFDSPRQCLAILGCGGLVSGGAWLVLGVSPPGCSTGVSLTHLAMASVSIVASLIVAATGNFDRRGNRAISLGFFLSKTILAVGMAGLVMASLSAMLTSGTLQLHGYLLAYYFACRWSIVDDRLRCPVCGWRTQYPVRMGTWPALLLDWVGTESMCPHGHGLMYASTGLSSFPPNWWSPLDPSWRRMFKPSPDGKSSPFPPSRA